MISSIIFSEKLLKALQILVLTIVKWKRYCMTIVLCNEGSCVPPKCPIVDVQEDKVIIGEKDNICTLTREQFDILKEKIKNDEV